MIRIPATLALAATCLATASVTAHGQFDLLESWEGHQSGEQFGIAVALGLDANNDGWADLAVGASTNDEAGDNAGKVSIYLGAAVPSSSPDLVLYGEPGSFFGSAVAWAGDVNGDGFDDLLVGAYRDSEAGVNAGKAYLFLGGNPMGSSPALVIAGPGAGAYFGRAVSGAGRINADGYDDFAIGAPRTASGSVYVYFGGASPDTVPDAILQGMALDDRFGSAIAGAGNMDGLSGDDLLVGAPRASPSSTWQGAAYLFSGGAGFDAVADWACYGEAGGDEFGTSLACGDVNGDGTPDILVGAPYANVAAWTNAGAAYLYDGGSPIPTTPFFTILGAASDENMGRSVSCCGDVTGSGFGHILVGAPGASGSGADSGRAVLSPGGSPPDPADFINLSGEAASDQFGHAVGGTPAAGLSFTGGPRPDLAVGAWGSGVGGKAYLFGMRASSADLDPVTSRESMRLVVAGSPGRTFRIWLDGMDDPAGVRQVRILAVNGRVIRCLANASNLGPTGMPVFDWDGSTQAGEQAPAGVYVVRADTREGTSQKGRLVLLR